MLERLVAFVLALLLLFLSAWNYSVFMRLQKEHENGAPSCRPAPDYIKRGKTVGTIFVAASALLVVVAAGRLYLQRRRK